MLVTLLATLLVLGVLILIHELGHFWVAKAVGIAVPRFSIGFGPRIAGFRWGETEYVLSAIPLGGYVKMAGMAEEEALSPLEGESRPEEEVPPERGFDARPLWARAAVVLAGVSMNMLFAYVALVALAHREGIRVPLIDRVEPGMPAAAAGLLPGDQIVRIGGRPVRDQGQVQLYVAERARQEFSLTVLRDGVRHQVQLHAATVRRYDDLARDTVTLGRIGVAFATRGTLQALGWGEAAVEGWHRTSALVLSVGRTVTRLVSGRQSARELGGPILIGELSGAFARAGFWPLLSFMALISINLAVLNLLPIPVLDGGHLMLLAVEGVRGRSLSLRQRTWITQVGLVVIVGLMALAVVNDLMRHFR